MRPLSRRKSIAARLFLWLFFAGLVALVVGGGLLYLEIRAIILSALDHTLASEAEIFSGLLHEENGGLEFEYAEATSGGYNIPRSGHYYEMFVDGALFACSPSLAGERLDSYRGQGEGSEVGTRYFTAVGPAGEKIRGIEKTGRVEEHATTIIVAHTLEESLAMLRRFRNFLLGVGPAAILLLALVGWLIADRSLRPLRTFSAAVRRTTERTLDQRMDTANQYREFSALAASFNEMLDRLQQSFAARENLLSDVSHELKTPVAVIRSHCDVYLQKVRPPDEYVEALGIIRETADAMGVKIRRLLNLAQIESDLLSSGGYREIPLEGILNRARLTVEPLARERQVLLAEQIDPGLTVFGQEERLTEAFASLLENAVKYNRVGGSVDITARREGERAKVRIEDTGRGIAPEELPRIFDRFYRGKLSRAEEGTGLGLCIVKAIVEAHDGTIEVASRPGEGSCFTVTLPLSAKKMPARGANSPGPAS